jgi:hypothetical protein
MDSGWLTEVSRFVVIGQISPGWVLKKGLKGRVLLLYLLALTTVRIEQDSHGVWTGRGPGVEVIYLPEQAGPALWLYLRGLPGMAYRGDPRGAAG